MEFLKWLIMIVAIFVLLILGCYFLLKSEERKRQNTKLYLGKMLDMLSFGLPEDRRER